MSREVIMIMKEINPDKEEDDLVTRVQAQIVKDSLDLDFKEIWPMKMPEGGILWPCMDHVTRKAMKNLSTTHQATSQTTPGAAQRDSSVD